MSTRCNIHVVPDSGEPKWLYHHHDGYPMGVGWELIQTIMNASPYDSYNGILKDLPRRYEDTDQQHGDIEYLYSLIIEKTWTKLQVARIYDPEQVYYRPMTTIYRDDIIEGMRIPRLIKLS